MTLITADPQPSPPPRPPRPTSVTVAFWLQLGAVLLLLGLVGLLIAHAIYYNGQISRVVAVVPDANPVEVSDERSGNIFRTVLTGAVLLWMAAWLAATAVPMRRGRNLARILVFVCAGAHLLVCLAPCAGGVLAIPSLIGGIADNAGIEEVPWEQSRFLDTLAAQTSRFDDAVFGGVTGGIGIEWLLVTAIAVLLLTPPANRYFLPRPQPPVWPGGYPSPGPQQWGARPQPYPGLPYVICPDPSAHVPPPDSDPAAPV
jgi:hypothetical protein